MEIVKKCSKLVLGLNLASISSALLLLPCFLQSVHAQVPTPTATPTPFPKYYPDSPEHYLQPFTMPEEPLKGYTKWEQWCNDKNLSFDQQLTVDVIIGHYKKTDCLELGEYFRKVYASNKFYEEGFSPVVRGKQFRPKRDYGDRENVAKTTWDYIPGLEGKWYYQLRNLEPLASIPQLASITLSPGNSYLLTGRKINRNFVGLGQVCKLQKMLKIVHLFLAYDSFPVRECSYLKDLRFSEEDNYDRALNILVQFDNLIRFSAKFGKMHVEDLYKAKGCDKMKKKESIKKCRFYYEYYPSRYGK
jgi:hypothetical protein